MVIRKRSQSGRKKKKKKSTPVEKGVEIETLVKEGVERFILKDGTIDDFLRTLRSATAKEYVYSHQLTQSLFSKIVRQAIATRKRRLRKSTLRLRTHSKKGNV